MIVVAIAALIGGRAYHVIDQWALYKDDLPRIVLPRTRGLASTVGSPRLVALVVYARRLQQAHLALGRHHRARPLCHAGHRALGNFFNQEL